jgi:hypothetical protein
MIADPFGHFKLAIHHALIGRDVLSFKVEMNVFTSRRLVDHANSDDKLNHFAPPGVGGMTTPGGVIWSNPGRVLDQSFYSLQVFA